MLSLIRHNFIILMCFEIDKSVPVFRLSKPNESADRGYTGIVEMQTVGYPSFDNRQNSRKLFLVIVHIATIVGWSVFRRCVHRTVFSDTNGSSSRRSELRLYARTVRLYKRVQ